MTGYSQGDRKGYSQGDRKGKWLAIVKDIEKANGWL
jgi:hypothetical protein